MFADSHRGCDNLLIYFTSYMLVNNMAMGGKTNVHLFNTITYGHNTIRYQGSKIWNNLYNNLKMSNGLSSFKKSIQKWSGPECHCGYCLQCTLAHI